VASHATNLSRSSQPITREAEDEEEEEVLKGSSAKRLKNNRRKLSSVEI